MSEQNIKISEKSNIKSENHNIQQASTETKRISALVPMNYIQSMSEHNLTPTEAVKKGLEILFSDDYNNMNSYKNIISAYEKKFAIQEAQLSELETIKKELERVHNLLTDQKELDKAHLAQVQSLINEISLRDETLLLPSKKEPWWKTLLK